jgi:hypothetical protein
MSSILTVTSIKSGRRHGIFAEADACFGYSCTERIPSNLPVAKKYSRSGHSITYSLHPALCFCFSSARAASDSVNFRLICNCYARRVRHTLCGQLVALTHCVKESMCAQELAQGVPWSIHSRVSVINLS